MVNENPIIVEGGPPQTIPPKAMDLLREVTTAKPQKTAKDLLRELTTAKPQKKAKDLLREWWAGVHPK